MELGQLQDDLTDGFDTLGAAISDQAERPDGGTPLVSPTMIHEQATFDLELQPPTGVGAVTGVLIGSVLGAPFGFVAVVAGGLLGGLMGHGFEYRKQKARHRAKLRWAASQYLRRHVSPPPRLRSFEGVSIDDGEEGTCRVFEFRDDAGRTHRVKLYRDERQFALD